MRRGFTLIEMLVAIGIIAVLIAASTQIYGKMVNRAYQARCQELVHNVATALEQSLQENGSWPSKILAGAGEGKLTARVGGQLAKRGLLSLRYREEKNESEDEIDYTLVGLDRCGIVSPWAAAVVKGRGDNAGEGDRVPSGGKIGDHVLRYALDTEYRGKVTARCGESVTVRGVVAVWCCGADGLFGTDDDVKSWAKGQEE